jgi:anti-anti-sigma factor
MARDRALIAPIGELDLVTASPLHDFLTEVEDSRFDRLVLDLRRLSFMDCSGLRTVLEADARARQAGRQLEVVCFPGQVRRLLALTGAEQQLDVVELPVAPSAAATINGVAA